MPQLPADAAATGNRYGRLVRWRAVVLDAVVAALAFAAGAGALAQNRGAADVRDPDAAAYALLAVFCASAVVRRWEPIVALAAVLASGSSTPAPTIPRR